MKIAIRSLLAGSIMAAMLASVPAADAITEMGFSRVYSVTDGFEGGRLEEGGSRGVRAVNG